MNRSTLWLLATAVVLAVATWFITRKPTAEAPPRLNIEGYATAEQLGAEKARGLLDEPVKVPCPIDEITITWPGRPTIELKRNGEGDAAIWELIAPQKGVAQSWVVDQMTALFKGPTLSREARRFQDADARLYGFEPERKARITLKSKGSVWNGADLFIGDVREGRAADDAREPPDTWVMMADNPGWVFAVAAKDLRTALDRKVEDLRDKKVFRFTSDDLVGLRVEPPEGQAVVLAASGGSHAEGDDGAPTPTIWSLTEPAGVTLDASAQSFGRNVAELRAQSFETAAAAPPEATSALAGKTWRFALTTKDTTTVTLIVEAATGDKAWARIEGSDEFIVLAGHTVKTLTKGLEDLRDRNMMTFDVATIDRITAPSPEGTVTVARTGDGWRFIEPATPFAADPSRWLTSLKGLTALRWARPNELATAGAALANAIVVVKLEGGGQQQGVEIRFGAPFEQDGQQVRWGVVGNGDPFVISDFQAKKAETTIADLRPKKPVAWSSQDIDRLAVEITGETGFILARDAATKALAVIEPSGAAAGDPESLVRALVGLEAGTFATDPWDKAIAGATGHATVTITNNAGEKLTLRIARRGEDADPLLVADAGPLAGAVITVSRQELDNLLKLPTP